MVILPFLLLCYGGAGFFSFRETEWHLSAAASLKSESSHKNDYTTVLMCNMQCADTRLPTSIVASADQPAN